jgi:hypothetical protein
VAEVEIMKKWFGERFIYAKEHMKFVHWVLVGFFAISVEGLDGNLWEAHAEPSVYRSLAAGYVMTASLILLGSLFFEMPIWLKVFSWFGWGSGMLFYTLTDDFNLFYVPLTIGAYFAAVQTARGHDDGL